MRRKGPSGPRLVLPAGLAALALAVVGCGAEDRRNEPRPPSPAEVSAKVGEDKVVVSPSRFGAGLAVFSISNQTDDIVQLALEGPTEAVSAPIEAGSVTDTFKVPMLEGEYAVSAGEESRARPAELLIGPKRPSSQNELLLP
ncbi:MAG: hypothetical protein ACRDL1_13450 [Solirubrobacterales bacterium]